MARFLREAGVPIVDADQLARRVVVPGSPGLEGIRARFGAEVIGTDGELDRKRLGALVFASPEARSELESILHPLIKREAELEFERHGEAGARLVCYEIPLLFETEQEERYRPVIVVHVPEAAQLARVVRRDGGQEADALRRIEAQIPLDHKAEQADFVIDNTGSLDETREQTLRVLHKIQQQVG